MSELRHYCPIPGCQAFWVEDDHPFATVPNCATHFVPMDRRVFILEKREPLDWEKANRWQRLWLWLTNAQYRAFAELSHPAVFIWRCIWFVPCLLSLALYCAVVCIAFGPEQARRTFGEGW